MGSANAIYAINPNGSQRWIFPGDGAAFQTPAVGADGALYDSANDGNLYSITPGGAENWVCSIGSPYPGFVVGGGSARRSSPLPVQNGCVQMKKLGNSDMALTPIGVGAWAIGGAGYAFGWGEQDDERSIAAIRKALDAGMNWIDTAAVYGLGHSEEVVAKALEGATDRPYVFTKCERCWDENGQIVKSLKRDSLRQECENSLRRLKVDVIDLYQVHWPEPDEDIEEGWTALAELQQEGKVRFIGVSNFNAAQMARAQKIAPITSLQPPYSLLRRGIEEEILPFALANGIGVIVYSPMASGLLSGSMTADRIAALPSDDWRSRSAEFQEPKLSHNLALAAKLAQIGEKHGRTAGEAAIAWTLRHPAVTAAIVGVRGPEQVAGVEGALEFRLSDAEASEVEAAVPQ